MLINPTRLLKIKVEIIQYERLLLYDKQLSTDENSYHRTYQSYLKASLLSNLSHK